MPPSQELYLCPFLDSCSMYPSGFLPRSHPPAARGSFPSLPPRVTVRLQSLPLPSPPYFPHPRRRWRRRRRRRRRHRRGGQRAERISEREKSMKHLLPLSLAGRRRRIVLRSFSLNQEMQEGIIIGCVIPCGKFTQPRRTLPNS